MKSFSSEIKLGTIAMLASFGAIGIALLLENATAVVNWWIPWLIYVLYLFSKHSKRTPFGKITHRFSDDPLIWGILIGASAVPVMFL